ncbi:hypothetical protein [Nocardiopsis alborubida]|nr:hypothetical protein [Nocardiopsis alborubida]
MHQPDIDRMRDEVLAAADMVDKLAEAKPLHSWELSHVERLTLTDGSTVVFKCATEPFTHEHEALTSARQAGVSVPHLIASLRSGTTLAMLMEDLGEPDREATDHDGVAAAVQLHSAAAPPHLPLADSTWLASLPRRATRTLDLLNTQGRWSDADDIRETLSDIDRAACARAEGTTTAPYGWVHSEFHPESLHIRDGRVRLYDLARAFHGPGLIDLASWHGTVEPPDSDRTRAFLESYVEAGGSAGVLTRRAGLPPQDWALGWHRVWALEWFLAQSLVWIGDTAADPAYTNVVRRHTHDAARLLDV